MEAEEEEAIFTLALCSLWTSQERMKIQSGASQITKLNGASANGMSAAASQEMLTALSNERKRCRVLVAERNDAASSVSRSEEAMQRLLKGASSMRTFFTQKVRDLEASTSTSRRSGLIQSRAATPKKTPMTIPEDDNDDNNNMAYDNEHSHQELVEMLANAKNEISERELESEELALELEDLIEQLNECHTTIAKLEHCGFKNIKNNTPPPSSTTTTTTNTNVIVVTETENKTTQCSFDEALMKKMIEYEKNIQKKSQENNSSDNEEEDDDENETKSTKSKNTLQKKKKRRHSSHKRHQEASDGNEDDEEDETETDESDEVSDEGEGDSSSSSSSGDSDSSGDSGSDSDGEESEEDESITVASSVTASSASSSSKRHPKKQQKKKKSLENNNRNSNSIVKEESDDEEDSDNDDDLLSQLDDLSVAMQTEDGSSRLSSQQSAKQQAAQAQAAEQSDARIAQLVAELTDMKAALASATAELEATKTEVSALSAASGVDLPGRLNRQESFERTAAMLTLQAEADLSSAKKVPCYEPAHREEGEEDDVASSTMGAMLHASEYEDERLRSRKSEQDAQAKRQFENDRDSDLAIANRTMELKSSIQDAIATTMAYLKGHLVQLRPNDKAFLNRAIASCAAGFELRLFREAHLTIKRAVLEVAGEQSRYVRRWLIPAGSLSQISPHKQHELLKQIRLLVVAYDNMNEDAREKLTTAAEVLANLDVLIEVGQVCLSAERSRRQSAPRPLRPSHYGAHDIPLVIDGSLVPMDQQSSPHQNLSQTSTSGSSGHGHGSSSGHGPSSSGHGHGPSSSSAPPPGPMTDYYPHPAPTMSSDNTAATMSGVDTHNHHHHSTSSPPNQTRNHNGYHHSPNQNQPQGLLSPIKSPMKSPGRKDQQPPSNVPLQQQPQNNNGFADLGNRELFHNDISFNTPPKSRQFPSQFQQHQQQPPMFNAPPVHYPVGQQQQQPRYAVGQQQQRQQGHPANKQSVTFSSSSNGGMTKTKGTSAASKVQAKLEERELASLQRKQALRRRQNEKKTGPAAVSLLSSAERKSIEMLGSDLPSYLTYRSSDVLLERQAKAKAASKLKTQQGKTARGKAVRY
mmetsp:Transcript_18615/g.22084  ORF Transcript_18615/g.22084 Transcript_18615/m.22084 type:complete len:1093 (-) Transcript_18615:268-3546(-)